MTRRNGKVRSKDPVWLITSRIPMAVLTAPTACGGAVHAYVTVLLPSKSDSGLTVLECSVCEARTVR